VGRRLQPAGEHLRDDSGQVGQMVNEERARLAQCLHLSRTFRARCRSARRRDRAVRPGARSARRCEDQRLREAAAPDDVGGFGLDLRADLPKAATARVCSSCSNIGSRSAQVVPMWASPPTLTTVLCPMPAVR
jgi:hypothetical protein